MNQLLSQIVLSSAKHAKWVLAALLLLFIVSLAYSSAFFKINSDLGQLIKPSPDTRWYSDNEKFKQQFPSYQDTALVAVSGSDGYAVHQAAEKLLQAIKQNPSFSDVFAPQLSDFQQQRVFYAMPLEGVRKVTQAFGQQFSALQILLSNPSLNHYSEYLLAQVDNDQKQYFLSQNTKQSLKHFNQAAAEASQGDVHNLPRLLHPFVGQDQGHGFVQLISVKAQQDFAEKLPNAKVIASLKSIIAKAEISPAVAVNITGELMLAHEEVQAGLSGVEIAGVLSLVLLLLILAFGLRSKAMIMAIFVLLIAGSSMTTALGLLLVGSFNTLSLIFLVMFFGIGVDFAVHFCSKIAEDLSQKFDYLEALKDAVNDMGTVLLLCALSTSIAFLSFLPTDYQGLGELGVVSAGGMAVALLLTLIFLPAWFACFPMSVATKPVANNSEKKPWSIKKAKQLSLVVIVSTVLLTAFSISTLGKLGFDFSVLALRNSDTEGMKTLLQLQRQGQVTDYSIAVMVDENLPLLPIISQLEALDSVKKVISINDLVPKFQALKEAQLVPYQSKLQSLKLAEKPVDSRSFAKTQAHIEQQLNLEQQDIFIDDDAKLLQQFTKTLAALRQNPEAQLRLQKAVIAGLKKDYNRLQAWFSQKPFNADDLPKPMRERFIASTGQNLLIVLPAKVLNSRSDIDGFIRSVKTVAKHPAGRAVVEWGVGSVVVQSFIKASLIAAALIFVLLLAYFRQLIVALCVMLPLSLSCLLTLAVVAISDLSLNMANILVVPLIFGLGVDTGIHVVHRYFSHEGVASLYQSSTFKAVVISALTTIGTFLSLLLSPHKGAASIGLLLAIAISLMLLLSFTVLPALLFMLEQRKQGKPCSL